LAFKQDFDNAWATRLLEEVEELDKTNSVGLKDKVRFFFYFAKKWYLK